MKKKIVLIITSVVLLCICFILPTAAEYDSTYTPTYPRVYDEIDLLTDSQEQILSDKLVSLSNKYGYDFVIHTVYNLGNNDNERGYNAEKWYDAQGFKTNGIMCTYEQRSNYKFFTCSGKCDDMITYSASESILDVICTYADRGNYFSYFDEFLDEVTPYIDYYEENGSAYVYRVSYKDKIGKYVLISVVIALIVAGIMKSAEKKKLTSVASKQFAGDYIVNGSMKITGEADLFLYSTVSRVRRQTQSSSGSSHTSHSSGSHSSSHGRH